MNSTDNETKFTVAIVGGGLGGLTAAIARAKSKDIHIDIYEAAHQFTDVGAGVGMWPRPWQVLKALGLEDAIRETVDIPEEHIKRLSVSMRKSDQPKGISFYDLYAPMGNVLLHRADFQRTLVSQLDPAMTTSHFAKRLVSYTQPAVHADGVPVTITLHFEDRSTATCDVLVGADGIHSVTRGQLLSDAAAAAEDEVRANMLLDMIEPIWSGYVAYRGVIPKETLAAVISDHRAMRIPTIYIGKNKHVVAFPISRDSLVNVAAFCYDPAGEDTVFNGKTVEYRPQQELLDQYADWEPEVTALLQCIEKPSRWIINQLKGLPISTHGRVALLGDAAHAMTPHQGSGAGQALEDSYILGALLAHPLTTHATVSAALQAYEAVRLPHTNGVQRRSQLQGHIYDFVDPRFADLAIPRPDMQRMHELGEAVVRDLEWVWTTSVENDKKRALELLEERLVETGLPPRL